MASRTSAATSPRDRRAQVRPRDRASIARWKKCRGRYLYSKSQESEVRVQPRGFTSIVSDSRYPYLEHSFTHKRVWLHGHRIRSDRHRTDAGKGSLREAVEDRSHRRTVPAVRRIRPDRQGRGGFLRRDRKVGRVEDPLGRRREGDQDAGPGVLLVTGRGPGSGGSGFDDRARRALSSDTRGGAPPRDQLSGSAPRGRRTSTVVAFDCPGSDTPRNTGRSGRGSVSPRARSPPACYHHLVVTARSSVQLPRAGILHAAAPAEDPWLPLNRVNHRG